jgi:hypothetical protein
MTRECIRDTDYDANWDHELSELLPALSGHNTRTASPRCVQRYTGSRSGRNTWQFREGRMFTGSLQATQVGGFPLILHDTLIRHMFICSGAQCIQLEIMIIYWHVGLEVLRAVVMKRTIFWDITPCSPLSFNRRSGRTYRLHLHGRKNISWARNQSESRWQPYSLYMLYNILYMSVTTVINATFLFMYFSCVYKYDSV